MKKWKYQPLTILAFTSFVVECLLNRYSVPTHGKKTGDIYKTEIRNSKRTFFHDKLFYSRSFTQRKKRASPGKALLQKDVAIILTNESDPTAFYTSPRLFAPKKGWNPPQLLKINLIHAGRPILEFLWSKFLKRQMF